MPDHTVNQAANPEQDEMAKEDLTGRERLVSNVIFNWAGHFVFMVAGFILPRMIDRRLGQELLGVWDFAWSLVGYFQIVGGGIASSVNRYVARYRIAGDISGVNRIVSSACFVLTISGVLVLGLAIAVSLLIPHLFGTRLKENVHEAQWVVCLLGANLGVEIAFQAYNGVLTGCHRWGLRNLIESGWYVPTLIAMSIALIMGQGLRTLSLINLIWTVLVSVTRMAVAYRVCEGLRVHPSLVAWKTIREQLVFGAKTLIPHVSQLLLNQTTSILILAYLGPAMLALYTRPRSLLFHVDTLVDKMAFVLTPTTGSLQSQGSLNGIQELLMTSVRYSFYLVLPMVLVLVVFGGVIMQIWMGPRYDNGLVPAILAVGFLGAMVQRPIWVILVGLNGHGRAGIAALLASLCSVLLIVFSLGVFRWGLLAVAVGVSVPLTVMNLAYLPFLARRWTGLPVRQYFRSVTVGPTVHVLPFAACLVAARLLWSDRPLLGLAVGGGAGGLVLAILYWRYVLPDRIKMWILRGCRKLMQSANFRTAEDSAVR
jgi:O-antigen/teichoic acid export membrane protein